MKVALLCITVLLAVESSAAKKRFDNYQVLAIKPENVLAVKFVHRLGDDIELDMWKETTFVGDESHIMIPPHRLEEIKRKLTKRNIPFSIHTENVQDELNAEELRMSKRTKAFSYDQYNVLADIYDEIERLVNDDCPALFTCESYDIGTTVEGRPLTVMEIRGPGADRPAVWIDSAIHAREWLAPATVMRFIRRVFNGDDGGLRNTYDFYFLPIMNPDGYAYTHTDNRMWRKNREPNQGSTCFGTDLNRNYATNWGISGTSTSPCSDLFHGSGPGSCAETEAVQNKLLEIAGTLSAFVTVHTYGEYWLHAWGHEENGNCVIADDHDDLYAVADAASIAAENAEPTGALRWRRGNSCETIYPASGLTLEYAKTPGGTKYTYTPELRGNSFTPTEAQIDPSDNEFFAAITAQMAEIEAIEGRKK